jgi:serine/threonine protein kinase
MVSVRPRTYDLAQPTSGEQVGNYLLLHELGRGGHSHIYLGEHLYLKSAVALKLLNLSVALHEDFARFQFEARLLASLRHRHIVRALDFGWEQYTPFLVMDYASRGPISWTFPRGVPLSAASILPAVLQIASALQYIHDRNIIHCDIKPENILLGPHNEVWLADFGIAATSPSSPGHPYIRRAVRGTPRYIAPEQAYGNPLPASDQYALAVMVYEWLCGQPPFHGSALELCSQHVSTPPPRLRDHVPSISWAVERVVLKALSKDPQQRFAHVLEFATALKQASQRKEHPLFRWLLLH